MKLPPGFQFKQERNFTGVKLENKVYVTAFWSDGDNIQNVQNFFRDTLWNNRQPGMVPTGWEISSQMSFLMPWILMYYYTNASSTDYFVAALSGKGYMYPQDMNSTQLQAYYAGVPALLARDDMTEVHTMNIGDASCEVTGLLGNSTDMIFDGYGGGTYQPTEMVNGMPLAHSLGLSYEDQEQIFEYLETLQQDVTNQPVFVFLNVLNWDGSIDPHYWNEFAARLQAAGFDVVLPDIFAYLAGLALPASAHAAVVNVVVNAVFVSCIVALGVVVVSLRGKGPVWGRSI
jgi:hypothetical protein